MKKNTVRIIGGVFRSRLIDFPDVDGLRPTHDRIRETLFNWLQQDISNAICLDLFAGSGALGFEAISRGAEKVTMIESNASVIQSLEENKAKLDVKCVSIVWAKFPEIPLSRLSPPYHIVFVDPHFALQLELPVLNWLLISGLLAKNALIYLESGQRDLTIPPTFETLKSGKTKTLRYFLLQLKD